MSTQTCSHCGGEVPASKIKCSFCGHILHSPERREELAGEGQVLERGRSRRGVKVVHGSMSSAELSVDTTGARALDVTDQVRAFARGIDENGLVHVFVPHATAGLALMETGAGSEIDLDEVLDRVFPKDDRYRHGHGARGHGRDHLIPVFIQPFLSIPCNEGNLVLGTWQRIVVVDPNEDNNERRIHLSFIPGRR